MRPRVIVLSTILPLPVDRGDRNRLFHLLRLLSTMADVRLLSVARAWEPPVHDVSPLAPVEVRTIALSASAVMAYGGWSLATARPYQLTRYALPRVRHFVARELAEFRPDVFWGFQAPAFPFLELATGQRRIIDLVDSPSRYAAMLRDSPDVSWMARASSAAQWRLRAFERHFVAHCHTVLVNSPLDLAHVRAFAPEAVTVTVLDNCVPRSMLDFPWQPDPSRRPTLLFVGNLAYAPNAAAVRRLVKEILPRVRQKAIDATLTVCGARGEALANELGDQPGVRFLGFVDDLVSLYRAASVMVVPVPVAGGTQYKLLESLAVGLPSVTSRVSAEVTGLVDGRQAIVADSSDEFAEAVLRVLGDECCARGLSTGGRQFIAENHTWESKRAVVARAIGVTIDHVAD
jgi:glycosyltransferase involved in cell wall biosynthesis